MLALAYGIMIVAHIKSVQDTCFCGWHAMPCHAVPWHIDDDATAKQLQDKTCCGVLATQVGYTHLATCTASFQQTAKPLAYVTQDLRVTC